MVWYTSDSFSLELDYIPWCAYCVSDSARTRAIKSAASSRLRSTRMASSATVHEYFVSVAISYRADGQIFLESIQ